MAALNPCHLGDIIVRTSGNDFRLYRVTNVSKHFEWGYLLTVRGYSLAVRLARRFATSANARAWVETPDHAYMELRTDSQAS